MKRTGSGTISLLALIGGVIAWCADLWLHTSARPILVPGLTLAPTLLVVAGVLVAVAWPIRRYTWWLRREEARECERRAGESSASAAEGRAAAAAAAAEPERAARPDGPRRPDPFAALRVLALAKACAYAGALLLGGCLGILLFVSTRSLLVPEQAALAAIGAAASAVLLAAGLVVESWCSLPPGGDAAARSRRPALD